MPNQFTVPNLTDIIITSKKSNSRKSIAIKINQGQLFLYFSEQHSQKSIQAFLNAKAHWIIHHYNLDKQRFQSKPKPWSEYLVQGTPHNIIIKPASANKIDQINDTLEINLIKPNDLNKAKQLLKKWYKTQTLSLTTHRCDFFASQMQLRFKQISTKSYKSRWGCCRSNGEIVFNDLLFMAPLFVVDAIVIHELAHLRYRNHSKQFWQYVLQFCPNYKLASCWLKQHQYLICLD